MFVALVPPPDVLAEVEAVVEPLRQEWPGLTWVEPANWHITLAFLGEVPDRAQAELRVRLARAAGHHEPLTLALGKAGAFTRSGRANALWFSVRAPARLARLAGSVAAGARRAGAGQTDDRPYRAHFTLARSRKAADLSPLVEALSWFDGTPWQATSVRLFESHLGPPLRYEPIEAYPLGGPD
ncbi:RNA 2',3'-cyclic phosphodiesterase [Acrocarpospora phusangensis]|uniref:RNA 2',3'-cyclic phosphodiesterase n=1 Tax=Acrocarpospora phusangensis TaxID=1070424 RepID=A0A919UPD9_9ACTN|nr:RNA 2',3'-cyclic phosphodiesterase [Acrocarpospora phusangensis]GIH28744.1 RNA 2',3'-cyclic phosphodiesterase [Acrocarpospora phusangensis]